MKSLIAAALALACLSATALPQSQVSSPVPTRAEPIDDPRPGEPAPTPIADIPIEHQLLRHPLSLIKHNGQSVIVCSDYDATSCYTASMPPEVGNVIRVVHSHFVTYDIAVASWLALCQFPSLRRHSFSA